MVPAISFALSLMMSSALVPLAMRYAEALGVVDFPDENRKIHSKPIPRVGGVAIVLAFFVPVLFWVDNLGDYSAFLFGALIIALFGFLDDRHDLNYRWKFFGQILAVIVFMAGNLEITETPFFGLGDPVPWLSYPVVALFLLGVTNAINLSDGLDGLAAGSSLLSLGFMALLSYAAADYEFTIFAVAAMGALTGFLRYNTHPASVFMGDTGSQFLGYVAGCLALMITQSESVAVSPMLPILIIGLPILDTLMVMALRLRDGVSPFKPDRRHLHHQFLAAGLKHYQAVAAIYFFSFALLMLAYLVRYSSDFVVAQTYVLFALAFLAGLSFIKHSPFARRRRQRIESNPERRNILLRRLSWLHHRGAFILQYFLAMLWLVFVASRSYEFGWMDLIAVGGLIALLLMNTILKSQQRLMARLVFYGVSALAIASITFEPNFNIPLWRSLNVSDLLLGALLILLFMVIRTTRKEHFRLDTQDILVLLVLLSAPFISGSLLDHGDMVGAVVRLAIVLYATEYMIARLDRYTAASILAMVTFVFYLVLAMF